MTSHLENELASFFHGWWRTQLGLWEGMKRNSLIEDWKPVSRLALWQQTCIPRRHCSHQISLAKQNAFLASPDNQQFPSIHQVDDSPRAKFHTSHSTGLNAGGQNVDDLDQDEQELLNASSFALSVAPNASPSSVLSHRLVRSYSVLVGIVSSHSGSISNKTISLIPRR